MFTYPVANKSMEIYAKTFWRVIPRVATFATKDFDSLEDARNYVQEHIDGFPANPNMSDENREYWKEFGRGLRIYHVSRRDEFTPAA